MSEWAGFHPCTCIAVDAQAYGRNDDRRQSEIQNDLPRLLSRAARGAGLDRSQWHVQPKGDEELAVYPMDGTEPRLVDDFVRHLVWELADYNQTRIPTARMRLRLAVDNGLVELASNGFAGAAVVAVSRLLNSPHLYEALRENEQADLVVLLSDHVYRSTVGCGHTTLSPSDFREVAVQVKEYESAAWLRVPGRAGRTDELPSAGGKETSPVGPEKSDGPAATSGVTHRYQARQLNVNNFAGPVDLSHGVVGFGGSHG